MKKRKSNAFILSAPSGAGKSSLIELLLNQSPSLCFSVSHTTRPPRAGETDGIEYYFISKEEFEEMIAGRKFLEWAEVHGYFYGTSRAMLDRAEKEGKDLLLDVDVQGAAKIKEQIPDAVTIFILPPSFEVLRERLVRRQKDTDRQIAKRIENARSEIEHYVEYDYIIVNRDLASAFESLVSIIRSQQCRREQMEENAREVIDSFKPRA